MTTHITYGPDPDRGGWRVQETRTDKPVPARTIARASSRHIARHKAKRLAARLETSWGPEVLSPPVPRVEVGSARAGVVYESAGASGAPPGEGKTHTFDSGASVTVIDDPATEPIGASWDKWRALPAPAIPLHLLDQSIGKLREALATGEFDEHLDALEAAERGGKTRKGAIEAIGERREAATDG